MTAQTASPITSVSDTAIWVAMYRALESDRPDALFVDPFARRLAGPRGDEMLARIPRARRFGWPMVVRTALMDEIILRAIRDHAITTVLNLAAGLDTRPYRLDVPASLRWIDADLPGILDYKLEALSGERARCRYEAVRADLTDPDARAGVLARAADPDGRVLVVTEGLLIYLTADDVRGLSRDLAGLAGVGWWLIDLASPRAVKMMSRTWGSTVAAGNAPFRFAPPEGTAFFAPLGWREAEYHGIFDASRRLDRTLPLAGFWAAVARLYPRRIREEFKRFSGVVLLERRDPAPPRMP
ncbi:MAG: SAM-dependent methyltransferase [Vicinamibacterales bacterium]